MRSFKYFLLLLSITLVHACKKENLDQEPGEFDSEYEQIHMFEANGHEIQIYGDLKTFKTGYNNIYVRFIDANTGEALHPEQLSLIPIMHMMSKQHSCPHSLMSQTQIQISTRDLQYFKCLPTAMSIGN